jgi:hypothetical protein
MRDLFAQLVGGVLGTVLGTSLKMFYCTCVIVWTLRFMGVEV